jgi:hypothetical protein
MPLARLVNYVNGNVLTGPQLNAEFDNILNNGNSLITVSQSGASLVTGLVGSVSSNIGSFAANGYQLRSTSTIASLTATSSYSINTQTVGPIVNGRDQAAAFAGSEVHFYAITTGIGSTAVGGICSTKPPPLGPTLPTNYSAWAYLASAKYTAASSVASIPLTAAGSALYTQAGGFSILTGVGDTASVFTAATNLLSIYVPTISRQGIFSIDEIGGRAASTGSPLSLQFNIATASSAPITHDMSVIAETGSTVAAQIFRRDGGQVRLPFSVATPALWYAGVINTGTSASMSVTVRGFIVPNGDVG